jgi:hypothetical protein
VESLYVPTNEPEEATRKARKGTVRALKLAYLLLAAATPTVPAATPRRPPIDPPLTVALLSCQLTWSFVPIHYMRMTYL